MFAESTRYSLASVLLLVLVADMEPAYADPVAIDILLPKEERPFQFTDKYGDLVGFNVDIARAFGRFSGHAVNIRVSNNTPHALRNRQFGDTVLIGVPRHTVMVRGRGGHPVVRRDTLISPGYYTRPVAMAGPGEISIPAEGGFVSLRMRGFDFNIDDSWREVVGNESRPRKQYFELQPDHRTDSELLEIVLDQPLPEWRPYVLVMYRSRIEALAEQEGRLHLSDFNIGKEELAIVTSSDSNWGAYNSSFMRSFLRSSEYNELVDRWGLRRDDVKVKRYPEDKDKKHKRLPDFLVEAFKSEEISVSDKSHIVRKLQPRLTGVMAGAARELGMRYGVPEAVVDYDSPSIFVSQLMKLAERHPEKTNDFLDYHLSRLTEVPVDFYGHYGGMSLIFNYQPLNDGPEGEPVGTKEFAFHADEYRGERVMFDFVDHRANPGQPLLILNDDIVGRLISIGTTYEMDGGGMPRYLPSRKVIVDVKEQQAWPAWPAALGMGDPSPEHDFIELDNGIYQFHYHIKDREIRDIFPINVFEPSSFSQTIERFAERYGRTTVIRGSNGERLLMTIIKVGDSSAGEDDPDELYRLSVYRPDDEETPLAKGYFEVRPRFFGPIQFLGHYLFSGAVTPGGASNIHIYDLSKGELTVLPMAGNYAPLDEGRLLLCPDAPGTYLLSLETLEVEEFEQDVLCWGRNSRMLPFPGDGRYLFEDMSH